MVSKFIEEEKPAQFAPLSVSGSPPPSSSSSYEGRGISVSVPKDESSLSGSSSVGKDGKVGMPLSIPEIGKGGEGCDEGKEGLGDNKCWFRKGSQRYLILILAVGVLVFASTLLLVLRNVVWMTAKGCADCAEERFDSPTLIALTLAIGNLSCLAYFHIDRGAAKWRGRDSGYLDIRHAEDNRPPFRIIQWLPPACCQYTSNVLMITSLNAIAASTIIILRGTILCQCALITVFVLRRDLKVHHWLGILVITTGAILVATKASQVVNDNDNAVQSHIHLSAPLATVLLLISCLFVAISLFLQEYVIRKHYCPPFQSIGYIGMWECLIGILFIPIAHYVGFDSFTQSIHKLSTNRDLLGWLLVVYFVGSMFAALSLSLTRMGAVLVTSAVLTMSVVPTWICEQILKWSNFSIWSLFGIFMSTVGFVTYNGLVKTCWPVVNMWLDTYVIIRCDIYGSDGKLRHGSLAEEELEEKRHNLENRHDLGACTTPLSHHTATQTSPEEIHTTTHEQYLQSLPSRVAIINADRFQQEEDDMIGDAWILVRLSEESLTTAAALEEPTNLPDTDAQNKSRTKD